MNRFTILLLGSIIIGCSNQSSELLKNGLTKKADRITEYFISLKNQNNESSIDTLAIVELYYNDNDQITKRVQENTFDDSKMIIDFEYNTLGKISKEVGTIIGDSSQFTVNYIYKDSLLVETFSETKNETYNFKQIGKYKYNTGKSLAESQTSQIFIDLDTKDTTSNFLEINKFNENEYVIESNRIDYLYPQANNLVKSEYENGLLVSSKKYDSENSVVSITDYKYEFDKYNNWIKRELFVNNILKSIKTREIDYK